MKTNYGPDGIRVVGKAYEVRWLLKDLLERSTDGRETLAEQLQSHTTAKDKPAGQVIPFSKKGD